MIREIMHVVQDIQNMMEDFESVDFTWVCRKDNMVAHEIASLGRQKLLFGNWAYNPPLSLKRLIEADNSVIRRAASS